MAFTYRLYLENGEDVGTFYTAAPDWTIGDEFRSSDGNRYRIRDIVSELELVPSDFYGLFVVTPIELDEPYANPGTRKRPALTLLHALDLFQFVCRPQGLIVALM